MDNRARYSRYRPGINSHRSTISGYNTQHVMFIQHRSIHEFASIATMHPVLTAMYMPEDVEPGRNVHDDFGQLLRSPMVGHRAGLIENPERRSVSSHKEHPSQSWISSQYLRIG